MPQQLLVLLLPVAHQASARLQTRLLLLLLLLELIPQLGPHTSSTAAARAAPAAAAMDRAEVAAPLVRSRRLRVAPPVAPGSPRVPLPPAPTTTHSKGVPC